MGDIGQAANAAASVTDTSMNIVNQNHMLNKEEAFNAQQAAIQRDWSADQASTNRSFQKNMQLQAEDFDNRESSTAMQRRVTDLKQAGLNPLLAAGSMGGATAPVVGGQPGSMPTGASASAPGLGSPNIDTFTRLANMKLTNAQTANTQQSTKKLFWDTDAAASTAEILRVDSSQDVLMARQQSLVTKFNMTQTDAAILDQTHQLILKQNTGAQLDNDMRVIRNNIMSMDAEGQKATLASLIEMRNAINAQQTVEAKNIMAAGKGEESPYGKLATAIAYAQAVSQHVGNAAQAAQSSAGALDTLKGLIP